MFQNDFMNVLENDHRNDHENVQQNQNDFMNVLENDHGNDHGNVAFMKNAAYSAHAWKFCHAAHIIMDNLSLSPDKVEKAREAIPPFQLVEVPQFL